MKPWLIRLYPRAWRERYGRELEALLEDDPRHRWTDGFDLAKGALLLRLTGRSFWWMAAGAGLSWAAAYAWLGFVVAPYETRASMSGPANPGETQRLILESLGRDNLIPIVEKHGLYDLNVRLPLEDCLEHLRRDIKVGALKKPGDERASYWVAYQSQDPALSKAVLADLRSVFANHGLATGDPVDAGKRPPDPAATGMAAVGGAVAARIALWFRKRK